MIKLKSKFYYGISDTPFKKRYQNHKKSFRRKEYGTETDLAKLLNVSKGKSVINNCHLCLSEKLFIIKNLDNVNMLNKKSESVLKCDHINKRLLIKVKDDSYD